MQQDLTLPQVIAGLGDLPGRVNGDEEYVASVHEVMDGPQCERPLHCHGLGA